MLVRSPSQSKKPSRQYPQQPPHKPKGGTDSYAPTSAGPALLRPSYAPASPSWLKGAVTYGAVPPFFGDAPLQDMTDRLPELKKLGVDAIWLSPIQETDDVSAISYATTDFCQIRPDFGNKEDFRRLVDQAHGLGMKVLLDIAPNHVSNGHWYFEDAQDNGQSSPYYDYFQRDAEGNPQSYFDWDHLINLNYSNPEVKKMITQAFEYWVREFDVDGFRVDAAWGPRERNPEFWSGLNEHLRTIKPEMFMLAEASARDPYYLKNGFNAAYDWGENIGIWSWAEVFQKEDEIGSRLDAALKASPLEGVARFLNNNDTGTRFITTHGVDKTRVAATLLMTLPGVPVIYTGDEVGAEFLPYDDPEPLSFEDKHGLRPHYTLLTDLREKLPSLAEGDFTSLKPNGSAYGYVRTAEGADPVTVLLNFGSEAKSLEVPSGRYRDVLSGRVVEVPAGGLSLPASSSLVLVPQQ